MLYNIIALPVVDVLQVVFSAVFYFVALPLYEGILMIGLVL